MENRLENEVGCHFKGQGRSWPWLRAEHLLGLKRLLAQFVVWDRWCQSWSRFSIKPKPP